VTAGSREQARALLRNVRQDLDQENHQALFRAKLGVGLRAALMLFIVGYMSWIFGALGRLDADQLTQIAASSVLDRLPQLRMDLRDYAIAKAPELTDKAQTLLLELPGHVRMTLEDRLMLQTDTWIASLEGDLDAALTTILDDQIELIRAESPGSTPEQQLDAIILGVGATFDDAMTEAMDEMYLHYAQKLTELNGHLDRLRRGTELTEQEQIDRQLIEAWMTLVHQHGGTKGTEVLKNIQAGLTPDQR